MRTAANNSMSQPETQAKQEVPLSLFEALFHHSADGMVVMNQWRQVIYMNPAATDLLGTQATSSGFCGDLFKCHDENGPLDDGKCFGTCVLSTHSPVSNADMNIIGSKGQSIPIAVTYSYIPFDDQGSYLLMTIRDMSERKRLEEAQRQNNELQYTLQERERLARDLHDGVVQDIAYANMQTKLMLDELEQGNQPTETDLRNISQILEQSFTELRQSIYDLTFRVSDDFKAYVKRYVMDYGTRYRILVHFHSKTTIPKLEAFVASQATKILQEALANVRKHAKATQIDVSLETLGRRSSKRNTVELTVTDNGQGFNTKKKRGCEHYGMRTMNERAELINAKLSVDSEQGKGTTIKLQIPAK